MSEPIPHTDADDNALRRAAPSASQHPLERAQISGLVASLLGHGAGDSETRAGGPATQTAEAHASGEAAPIGAWGELRLERWLGAGSFGEVYEAFDPQLERRVALKLHHSHLEAARGELIIDEGRRLARLRHPNVLTIYGAASHGGRVGIWVELILGQTLGEYLKLHGTLGAGEATAIGLNLASALAAVHAAGLVHRDLKPANVMREDGGRIVLMDFGCGSDSEAVSRADGNRVLAGTPLYMAPEQLSGGRSQPAMDIYALGVVLFHLVTGRFPVEAESPEERRRKILAGECLRLRDLRADLPVTFVAAVESALATNPADRPTAGELELALSGERRGAPAPQTRRAWLTAALVLMLATGIAVYAATQPRAPRVQMQLKLKTTSGDVNLHAGARVQPNDQIYAQFSSNRDCYFYAINWDDAQHLYLLYPLKKSALAELKALPREQRHRLPSDSIAWKFDDVGRTERIWLIAALERQTALEAAIRDSCLETQPDDAVENDVVLARSSALTRGGIVGALRGASKHVSSAATVTAAGEPLEVEAMLSELDTRQGFDGAGIWVKEYVLDKGKPEARD